MSLPGPSRTVPWLQLSSFGLGSKVLAIALFGIDPPAPVERLPWVYCAERHRRDLMERRDSGPTGKVPMASPSSRMQLSRTFGRSLQ